MQVSVSPGACELRVTAATGPEPALRPPCRTHAPCSPRGPALLPALVALQDPDSCCHSQISSRPHPVHRHRPGRLIAAPRSLKAQGFTERPPTGLCERFCALFNAFKIIYENPGHSSKGHSPGNARKKPARARPAESGSRSTALTACAPRTAAPPPGARVFPAFE